MKEGTWKIGLRPTYSCPYWKVSLSIWTCTSFLFPFFRSFF